MTNLYVRDKKTNEIIHTVPLHDPVTHSHLERVMLGMLRNMDTGRYVIDDDEATLAADNNEAQP